MASLAMRTAYRGSLGIVRAVMDDELDAISGAFIDSMATPWPFSESHAQANFEEDARRLAQVTADLFHAKEDSAAIAAAAAAAAAAATPPPPEPPLLVVAITLRQLLGAAAAYATAVAVLAAGCWALLAFRRWSMHYKRRAYERALAKRGRAPVSPPRVAPGAALNAINALAHLPIVAPLLDGVFWAAVSASAALLAPLVLAEGVQRSARELLRTATGGTEAPASARSRLAVVVTGCDSGFGRSLAIELAQRGYTVFACCLNSASVASMHLDDAGESSRVLNGSASRLRAVKADVTSDDEVAAAAAAVDQWTEAGPGRRLLAVVNNAGVGAAGFAEWASMKAFQADVNVNYLGVVRVCKAFLGALKRSAAAAAGPAPRVVIVSSMSGKLPLPMISSYSSTKHAVAAFAASLRMELSMFGIDVCTCLPSFHKTPLLMNSGDKVRRVWSEQTPQLRAEYGEPFLGTLVGASESFLTDWAWDPERVVEGLARAATSTHKPPRELAIGSDARFALNVLKHLPPAVYESVIYYWLCWDVIEPELEHPHEK
jgi:NAD(P)-dependent dehydrogenase (short-subunit alcohol dehydrogenase family)